MLQLQHLTLSRAVLKHVRHPRDLNPNTSEKVYCFLLAFPLRSHLSLHAGICLTTWGEVTMRLCNYNVTGLTLCLQLR